MTDDNVRPMRRPSKNPPKVRAAPMQARGGARGRIRNDPEVVAGREDACLDLFLRGASQAAIARQLGCNENAVADMITRGLAKRSDPAIAQHAREIMVARLELVLSRWMPVALGDSGADPNDRAAEIVLKTLDRLGVIQGVHIHQPVNNIIVTVDSLREDIARSLDETAARAEVVRAALTRVDGADTGPDDEVS